VQNSKFSFLFFFFFLVCALFNDTFCINIVELHSRTTDELEKVQKKVVMA
jgi:hypothetical protein